MLTKGLALHALKRFEEALVVYDSVLEIKPDFVEALINKGCTLRELKRFDEALISFDRVLKFNPRVVDALYNKGVVLEKLNKFYESIELYIKVLDINPNHVNSLIGLGVAFNQIELLEDALEKFNKAIAIQNDCVDAHLNRGILLVELMRIDDAFANFNKVLSIQPDHPGALYSRSLLKLLIGEYLDGWDGNEFRFSYNGVQTIDKIFPISIWDGECIKGKKILIFDEQGAGDIIQFSRYLNLLIMLGADVTFITRPNMVRILSSTLDGVRILTQIDSSIYDYQIALMSLPRQFKTTLETVPASTAYLQAEQLLVHKWRLVLGSQGLKVGIAWQGNPVGKVDIGRSIPLRCFAPLAAIPGVRLVSLQKNHGLDQLADLPSEMEVETLGSDFDEGPDAFVDTAAVMANLDLIITSDTSIAHLAGALGRPVWLALKHVPDWRWLLDRADSPWYPTMRLYRQTTRGDWTGVFERIAMDLARFEKDDR